MATDNYDRELNIGLASNEQQILNDIDVALKKIGEGTYGIARSTGHRSRRSVSWQCLYPPFHEGQGRRREEPAPSVIFFYGLVGFIIFLDQASKFSPSGIFLSKIRYLLFRMS